MSAIDLSPKYVRTLEARAAVRPDVPALPGEQWRGVVDYGRGPRLCCLAPHPSFPDESHLDPFRWVEEAVVDPTLNRWRSLARERARIVFSTAFRAQRERAEMAEADKAEDRLRRERDQAIAERDEARAWVRSLTSEQRLLTCACCGVEYPPGTPTSNHEALAAHLKVCAKHPMRDVERERDKAIAERKAMINDPLLVLRVLANILSGPESSLLAVVASETKYRAADALKLIGLNRLVDLPADKLQAAIDASIEEDQ